MKSIWHLLFECDEFTYNIFGWWHLPRVIFFSWNEPFLRRNVSCNLELIQDHLQAIWWFIFLHVCQQWVSSFGVLSLICGDPKPLFSNVCEVDLVYNFNKVCKFLLHALLLNYLLWTTLIHSDRILDSIMCCTCWFM